MIIFKITWKKKLGKTNKGNIITRHKETGKRSFYIPTDYNYFNHTPISGDHCLLENSEILCTYKTSSLIKCIGLSGNLKGEIRYILKPYKKTYHNFITFSSGTNKTFGDISYIKNFSLGDKIYNIECKPKTRAQICLALKSHSIVIKINSEESVIKLPSNKLKTLNNKCYSSYGFSDPLHYKPKTKAGDSRNIGIRPHVRGSAMNASDHSHGGGEGKAPIGKKFPHSFFGKKFKGIKTTKCK